MSQVELNVATRITHLLLDIAIKSDTPIYELLSSERLLGCYSDVKLLNELEQILNDLILSDYLTNKFDVEAEMHIRGY